MGMGPLVDPSFSGYEADDFMVDGTRNSINDSQTR